MRPERRIAAAPVRLERRAEGGDESSYLVGCAAVFDEWTTIYESRRWRFREVIRPGAFAAAIAERQDVRSLFNHDRNFVLGRTLSGTLTLRETDKGLLQETRLSGSQTVRDLVVVPIERGDISGMSFCFVPRNKRDDQTIVERPDRVVIKRSGERITEYYEGEQLVTERELLSVDLIDVTVATMPAYGGTSVGVRAADLFEDFEAMERSALERSRSFRRDQPGREDETARRRAHAHARLRLAEAENL